MSMLLITAIWRRSRSAGVPGSVSLRLMDGQKRTASVALGISSTKDEMATTYKAAVGKAMKLAYLIAEQWTADGRSFTIQDLAGEFARQHPSASASFAEKLELPVRYDENIAHFGRGFMTDGDGTQEILNLPHSGTDIIAYFGFLAEQFRMAGKMSTSRNIRSTGLRMAEYVGADAVRLSDIDSHFVSGFSDYLSTKALAQSTMSFYMRTLRMVLFHARAKGLLDVGADWFDSEKVHAGKDSSPLPETAMPINALRAFADYDFADNVRLALARDLFMFCFYMNGMEWTDAVLLTPDSILPSGYVVYHRRRKGVEKRVKLGGKARKIIEKYIGRDRTYIFPIINDTSPAALIYARYSSTRYLKIAGRRAGIPSISYNRARSSWLALSQQVNIAERLV